MLRVDSRHDIGLSSCELIFNAGIFLVSPHRTSANTFIFLMPSRIVLISLSIRMIIQAQRISICLFDRLRCFVERKVGQNRSRLSTRNSNTDSSSSDRLALDKTAVANCTAFAIANPTTIDFYVNVETGNPLTFSNIFFQLDHIKTLILSQINCERTSQGII